MTEFEAINAKLKEYTLDSVLLSSHQIIVRVDSDNNKAYPIWNVLVLMKWAYAVCKNSTHSKESTPGDVEEMVDLINAFHDAVKPVDFKQGIKRGLKILGFQQFWLQDHLDRNVLYRSEVFFNQIQTKLDIDHEFRSTSGLGLRDFLNCAYLLYIYFHRDRFDKEVTFDGVLYPEDLDAIFPSTGKDTFMSFLQLVIFPKIDPRNLQRMNFEGYQLYETTLWNRYPLLMVQDQVLLTHRSSLGAMIRNFLYDYLKKNSVPFRTELGERMERYVELGLKETNAIYLTEKQLQSKFSLQKVCDYLVEDDVLIECKAIELSPTAGIKRTQEILKNEFDSNATKAYIQILSVASNVGEAIKFGIVITFKETFLGYGKDAFEEFMNEPVTDFLKSQQIKQDTLPPERLVYITLEDWDRLVRLKKYTKKRLSEILETGFKSFQQNEVILFEQVLDKLCAGLELPSLQYLEHARPAFA